MPLQSPRFAGDPVLEACSNGQHRMMAPERGGAVGKVQQALIDLGFPLPDGADEIFGDDTGEAVVRFKQDHGLFPTDPVVGPGTMAALDADIMAFDAATAPPTPPALADPMLLLDEAIRAQEVSVSADNAVAEKLHGILSILLFEQATRMARRR